jgi:hypothetical protein
MRLDVDFVKATTRDVLGYDFKKLDEERESKLMIADAKMKNKYKMTSGNHAPSIHLKAAKTAKAWRLK